MERTNYAKIARQRADNLAINFGLMVADFEKGSRMYGRQWAVTFVSQCGYAVTLRGGSARELFYSICDFGQGLWFATQTNVKIQPS